MRVPMQPVPPRQPLHGWSLVCGSGKCSRCFHPLHINERHGKLVFHRNLLSPVGSLQTWAGDNTSRCTQCCAPGLSTAAAVLPWEHHGPQPEHCWDQPTGAAACPRDIKGHGRAPWHPQVMHLSSRKPLSDLALPQQQSLCPAAVCGTSDGWDRGLWDDINSLSQLSSCSLKLMQSFS